MKAYPEKHTQKHAQVFLTVEMYLVKSKEKYIWWCDVFYKNYKYFMKKYVWLFSTCKI